MGLRVSTFDSPFVWTLKDSFNGSGVSAHLFLIRAKMLCANNSLVVIPYIDCLESGCRTPAEQSSMEVRARKLDTTFACSMMVCRAVVLADQVYGYLLFLLYTDHVRSRICIQCPRPHKSTKTVTPLDDERKAPDSEAQATNRTQYERNMCID